VHTVKIGELSATITKDTGQTIKFTVQRCHDGFIKVVGPADGARPPDYGDLRTWARP